MSAPAATMTNAQAAQHIARTLGPVLPLCYADETGACACGGKYDDASGKMIPHTGHEIGKAPLRRLVKTGIKEATTSSATIDRWWRTCPRANIGLALAPAKILFIDPDSPVAYAEALAQGVDGGMRRSSRNDGFLFKRTADCPVLNVSKSADKTDLEIRADGYAVVWGIHQDGSPVRINLDAKLQDAPEWSVDRLKAKAAQKSAQEASTAARRAERSIHGGAGSESPVRLHTRGLRRWTGELVETKDSSQVDRSSSLFMLALDLADCNASESTIIAVLAERDETLGWRKFTDRGDAEERYAEIADKAVARAIARERQPQAVASAPVSNDVAELRAALDERDAEIMRLRRLLMDRDDRLEVLEPIVHQIDGIIARPEIETDEDGNVIRYGPTSDDKLLAIGLARWLPYHRAKREAKGERPVLALGYLAKVLGMPKRRVSKSLDRQSGRADSGAPFQKIVRRQAMVDNKNQPIMDEHGNQKWESSLEVRPWDDSPAATLRAAATYALPERPQHGGSKQASDVRWGRCPKHQNADIVVKGHCSKCSKLVGEKRMSASAFEALNVHLEHSELPGDRASPHVPTGNSIEAQDGHSDGGSEASSQDVRVVDSEPPVSLSARRRQTWQCPGCRAMERTIRADGSWRCLGSGHESADFELQAVSGGSE